MKLALIILLLVKCVERCEPQKSVNIALQSNWKQTPLYLEALEYLAEENEELVWHLVDAVHESGVDALNRALNRTLTHQHEYDVIIELVDRILRCSAKLSILKFSLSLRAHSPSVAMFDHMSKDIVKQESSVKDCEAFVEFSVPFTHTNQSFDNYHRFVCDLSDAKLSFEALRDGSFDSLTQPVLHKVDHIYPSSHSSDNSIIAILYGNIATNSFQEFHKYLKDLAIKGEVKYVMRHYVRHTTDDKVSLSGYGVELAIKSTEYKAQDDTRVKGEVVSNSAVFSESDKRDEIEGFIFSKLKFSFDEKKEKLEEFQSYLLDSEKQIATLKVWQLQEISLQAAKKIIQSQPNDALVVMRDIAQNFPIEARSLIKIKIDSEMKKEIERNQQIFAQNLNLGTGDTALFINGLYFDGETVDVFTLLDTIKKEIKLVEGVYRFVDGNDERLKKVIKIDINNNKQDFQIDIRDGAIIYINDIENDQMYRNWPSNLQDMLRPTYPGMLRNVRKNVYHLVLVIDPSKKEAHDIVKLAESFYVHKAPVRIGFIFAVSPNASSDGFTDPGIACLEAFNFIAQDKTPYDGLSFLTDVIASIGADKATQRDITSNDVINHFKAKYKNEDLELIFGLDSDYDTGRKLAWDYIRKTGIGNPIKALLNGVILKETYLNAELFEEVVLSEIMKQTLTIQKAIYKGELTDSDDTLDWLMSQKSVMPRLNHLILNNDEKSVNVNKYIDFDGDYKNSLKLDNYENVNLRDLQILIANSLKYIKTKEQKCNPVTLWLASNYENKVGRDMLLAVVSHLRSNSLSMRLAIVYNSFGIISKIIESATSSLDNSNNLLQFLFKFLSSFNVINLSEKTEDEIYENASLYIPQEYIKKFKSTFKSLTSDSNVFKLHNAFCVKVLSISDKDSAVVLNGRVIQIPINNPFIEDDFNLLEKFAKVTFTDKILSELSLDENIDSEQCSDLVMKISSVLLANPQPKTRHDIKSFSDKHSVLNLTPKEPNLPFIDITVILDPLTRGAQKLAPILIVFYKIFNSNIKIFFNCVDKHSDMPLKSFFRFVINSEPNFSKDGKLLVSRAYFSSMPTSPLLTLGMATPDNWLVEATEARYDLDNIHLDDVNENEISAQFELEYLLLEGHCFEQSTGNPPRGLQFTIGTNSTPVLGDTIVMANLGYFQLKANPGVWNLRLRQGRSEEIYNIISHEGSDSSLSGDVVVPIYSFRSNIIKIRVNKKAGKQNEELLYDSDDEDFDEANSLWNSFSWSSTPKKKSEVNITNDIDANRINIFSLASGHLYERLLRIMMLSVLKNTKTDVKFWFLKNYLSPSFKNVLPFLSRKYKFDYELVQYKWPRWLHQQTEKQRIIWGYKILFLDVLFPLDVKKIIFVDADQVVRADLKELRDLDLEGAPYGYTPFCESRKDMDGYRFWKTGYWATHLHNRKYHISALYVVDLQKFRRIAAGDRLRGQYQGLSQDPNSLSNLDQDLPNNMIHQVSIKSLPQDWLWCETWCSDESKSTAKTIDLCNNPKTKEPKLTSARRIVSEWETYDQEIRAMLDEYEKLDHTVITNESTQRSHIESHGESHSEL